MLNKKVNFLCIWVLTLTLVGCISKDPSDGIKESSRLPEQGSDEKKQRWDNMAREVDSWTDALGMPIDQNIKDTVIILNLLGFKTSQSCEGHLDRGLPYPWIAFDTESDEVRQLITQSIEISEKINTIEKNIAKKYPNLSLAEAFEEDNPKDLYKLYAENHNIIDKLQSINKKYLLPLQQLIEQFYSKCATNLDQTIIVHNLQNRIYSIGGDWQIIRDKAAKAIKLKEYQKEMRELTNFLIDYYFKTV